MKTFKNIEIKSEITEFTLGEFNKLLTIMENDETQIFTKYTDMMKLIGIPEDIALDCTIEELREFGSIFTGDDYSKYEEQEIIYINGRDYKLSPFNVRVGKLLEKYSKTFVNELPIFISAIRYQDTALTPNEHNDINHIKHKMELFSKEIATPFVVTYIKTMKELTGAEE